MLQQSNTYGRIYVVHNSVNDKVYVGQTIQSLHDRWRAHGKLSSARGHGIIAKAIQKYGKINFHVREVATASNKTELDNLEKLWIILLRSSENNCGYNRTLGGDGSLTEEARRKMRVPRPGTSQKLKGVKRPVELMETLRLSNIGRRHSLEWREQHRKDSLGRTHTLETKEKMSEARKTFWKLKSYDERIRITSPALAVMRQTTAE